MAKHYDLVEHTFGPGQTIQAVLKYYNDNNMTSEELDQTRIFYLVENNEKVPKAGQKVKIPVLRQYSK